MNTSLGIFNQKVKPQKNKSKKAKKLYYTEKSKFAITTEAIIDPKYKTELCKKYMETGKCPYGMKCRFAHGKQELIEKTPCVNYKKKACKTFTEQGFCPYGSRCSFRHDERHLKDIKLPYHFINLFIYEKVDQIEHRLPIFQEITGMKEEKDISSFFDLFKNIDLVHNSDTSTSSNEEESIKEMSDEVSEELLKINLKDGF